MHRLPFLVLAALLLATLWPVLGGDATLFYGDTALHFAPQKELSVEVARAGFAPLWNAWINLGEPLAANPSLGVFYLPGLIFHFCFDAGQAISLSLAIHLLFLAIGAYRFTRVAAPGAPWAAGTCGIGLALSGIALSYTTNPQYLYSLAWMPWILCLAHLSAARPMAAVAWGSAVAFSFLAGDPQVSTLAAVISVAYSWARGARRAIAVAAALGLAVGLVALLPSLELLWTSRRGAGLALEEAAHWSFHPWRLLTLLVPELFGMPGPSNTFWGHPLILGLNNTRTWFFAIGVGLPLWAGLPAARGRGVPVLAASLLGLVVMALGTFGPLFPLAHEWIPGVSAFRYPEKYLGPAIVLAASLGGLGLARVERNSPTRAVPLSLMALGAITLTLGAALWAADGVQAWIEAWSLAPNTDLALAETREEGLRSMLGGAAAFGVGALGWRVHRAQRLRSSSSQRGTAVLLPFLFFALTALEAMPRARRMLWTADPSLLDAPTELGRALGGRIHTQQRPPRMIRDGASLDPYPWPTGMDGERITYARWRSSGKPNFGLLEGLAYPLGYSGLETAEARSLITPLALHPGATAVRLATPHVVAGWPSSGAVLRDLESGALRLSPVQLRGGLRLLDVAAPLPAAHRVSEWLLGPHADTLLPLSGPTQLDTTEVVLDGRVRTSNGSEIRAWLANSGPGAGPVEETWSPNRVSWTWKGPGGLLVVRDRFAAGWLAIDDKGRRLPILKADGLLRAIPVPEDSRGLVLLYDPKSIRIGGWVSLLACLIGSIGLATKRGTRFPSGWQPLHGIWNSKPHG